MSDHRRKTSKGVRFDEGSHSGSSRASTTGGSTASSGSQYTAEYNQGALQLTLQKTLKDMDTWQARALDAEEDNDRLRKSEEEHKARIKALEHAKKGLEVEIREFEKELHNLKLDLDASRKENSKLRKAGSQPSSPESGKLHRSDSKKAKDPDAHNERLEERFNRSSPESSKPPSSSKPAHRSRRLSVSSSSPSTERQPGPYIEPWGPSSPVSPSGSSRHSQSYMVPPPMPPVTSAHQVPVYASTPRTTGMPMPMQMQMPRPTVELEYAAAYGGMPYVPVETGSYQYHPLPRSRP